MRFILVRHAETIANSENKIYGWSESEYSEKGKEQIKKIIELLKYESIDTIYSSPLKRALNISETLGNIIKKKVYLNFA